MFSGPDVSVFNRQSVLFSGVSPTSQYHRRFMAQRLTFKHLKHTNYLKLAWKASWCQRLVTLWLSFTEPLRKCLLLLAICKWVHDWMNGKASYIWMKGNVVWLCMVTILIQYKRRLLLYHNKELIYYYNYYLKNDYPQRQISQTPSENFKARFNVAYVIGKIHISRIKLK